MTERPKFFWGVATSAYQIEGVGDGREETVWDKFAARPGAIADGSDAGRTCGHYGLYKADVALLSSLGVNAYRFSLSWARDLSFYDRLVDELLARRITPFVTLYHWELPQKYEDLGGWRNRDTAYRFAEFCHRAARRLGDRVRHWITLNEPRVVVELGYRDGIHAPGAKETPPVLARVRHHLLLAHGLGLRVLRQELPAPIVGLADNACIKIPKTNSREDLRAAKIAWKKDNADYLEPLFRGRHEGHFPGDIAKPDDLSLISTPVDFYGLNVYHGSCVRALGDGYETVPFPEEHPRTTMGWPITPTAAFFGPKFMSEEYSPLSLLITEVGAAFNDMPNPSGEIHDSQRVEFLSRYTEEAMKAKKEGVPLSGMFVWSLMDNFEWERGFSQRFGLYYTDYNGLERIPKDSAHWFRKRVMEII